mmetsp:Transcript_62056/g.142846  ORF Transcript_62056/g.142846 Transcript_62056/m.142846 type:complete len:827 (+) Transcript_62056:38-2518(+)
MGQGTSWTCPADLPAGGWAPQLCKGKGLPEVPPPDDLLVDQGDTSHVVLTNKDISEPTAQAETGTTCDVPVLDGPVPRGVHGWFHQELEDDKTSSHVPFEGDGDVWVAVVTTGWSRTARRVFQDETSAREWIVSKRPRSMALLQGLWTGGKRGYVVVEEFRSHCFGCGARTFSRQVRLAASELTVLPDMSHRPSSPRHLVSAHTQSIHTWVTGLLKAFWPNVNQHMKKKVEGAFLNPDSSVTRVLNTALQTVLRARLSMPAVLVPDHVVSFTRVSWAGSEPTLVPIRCRSLSDGAALHVDLQVCCGDSSLEFEIAYIGTFRVSSVSLAGLLSVVVRPITNKPPFAEAVQCFFVNAPSFEFEMKQVSGMVKVPQSVLQRQVRKVFERKLAEAVVLPMRVVIPLAPQIERELNVTMLRCPRPEGMLRLEVLSADNLGERRSPWLPNRRVHPDPLVKIFVGAEEFASPSRTYTFGPSWEGDEGAACWIRVFALVQNISFQVLDCSHTFYLDPIGEVAPQSMLSLMRTLPESQGWLPLAVPEEYLEGSHSGRADGGRLRVRATYFHLEETTALPWNGGSALIFELRCIPDMPQPPLARGLKKLVVRLVVVGSSRTGRERVVATAAPICGKSRVSSKRGKMEVQREEIAARMLETGDTPERVAEVLGDNPVAPASEEKGGYLQETLVCRLSGSVDAAYHSGQGGHYSSVVVSFELSFRDHDEVLMRSEEVELRELFQQLDSQQAPAPVSEPLASNKLSIATSPSIGIVLRPPKPNAKAWTEYLLEVGGFSPAAAASLTLDISAKLLGLVETPVGPALETSVLRESTMAALE